MKWSLSVDNWDVKESSLSISSFHDGFRVGGVLFESKNASSVKILFLLFGEFEESSCQFFICFCLVFKSCIIGKGALLKASSDSISLYREALEPYREFLTSVKGEVICENSESELCGVTASYHH